MPSFRWENEEQFVALVNLLSMRNGGQLGTSDFDGDSDSDDDTVHPQHMSRSENDDLKKRFLDRFAEVLSRDKGGQHVASAAIRESDDRVTLFVARNTAFKKVDQDFFRLFETSFAKLSPLRGSHPASEDQQSAKSTLWNAMLAYNESRIMHYLDKLREHMLSFEKLISHPLPSWSACFGINESDDFTDTKVLGPYIEETHDAYMAFARKQLVDLIDLIRVLPSNLNIFGAFSRRLLVERAHAVRNLRCLWVLLGECLGANLTSKILSEIAFLGRLRSAYFTFRDAARKFSHFRTITITALAPPPLRKPPRPLDLPALMQSLAMTLNKPSIQRCVSANATVKQVERGYEERIRRVNTKGLHTHCEVQLVLSLASLWRLEGQTMPYIGCSKKSCFLCAAFLRSLPGTPFQTKGSHGKVYPMWTVPEVDGLPPAFASAVAASLIVTRDVLVRQLLTPYASRDGIAESTAACTVVPSEDVAIRGRRRAHSGVVESWIADQQRPRSAEVTAEPTRVEAYVPDAWKDFAQTPPPATSDFDECSNCGIATSRKCSKCFEAFLCSQACEKSYDSAYHNLNCTLDRPLDSADRLQMACADDLLPEEHDVLTDFGFYKLSSSRDRSFLLGLYQGLMYMGVESRELHQWQVEGTLTKNIIAKYEGLPEDNRGAYFRWFLLHQYILDPSATPPDLAESARAWFSIVRPHLDGSDRNKEVADLKPPAKMHSALLYAHLLRHEIPSPETQDLYMGFGFCTCTQDGKEGLVMLLYIDLITRCTFKEFWTAHASHRLVTLFDAYGLGDWCRRMQYLAEYLQGDINLYSVWQLNCFLKIDQLEAIAPVWCDYGFMNCRNDQERHVLKEAYVRLLASAINGADPVDMHRACISGRLYEFALLYIPGLDERFRYIMRNPYPLPDL